MRGDFCFRELVLDSVVLLLRSVVSGPQYIWFRSSGGSGFGFLLEGGVVVWVHVVGSG